MQVTRCDRCGRVIERAAEISIKESAKEVRIAREYDLCEKCRKDLEDFLDGKETGGVK